MLTRRDTMRLVPGGLALAGAAGCAAPTAGAGADLAVDAIVYFYPLVTMEMTRRVMTNVAEPDGGRAPMGHSSHPPYPDASFGRDGAERGHALHVRLGRCRQGAVWCQHAGREWPLLPVSDAGRLDGRVPGAGQANHGDEGAELRDHGAGLEGDAADGREGVQVADQPWCGSWGAHYCTGTPADYAAVHKMQDAVQPGAAERVRQGRTLRRRAKVDPSMDMKKPVREQVNELSRREYFALARS